MNFKLLRNTFTDKSTISELYLDQKSLCYALEDFDRGLTHDMPLEEINKLKVYGKTCIPYGHYKIIWQMSPHFKCLMPYLVDVPGYSGVMIHVGNTDVDTLGCILLGMNKQPDKVTQSTIAFSAFKWLHETSKDPSDWIEIVKA